MPPTQRPRAIPNLTRLVVLWLLAEHPLHGYQIKRVLSDPGLTHWFPIEFASIYSVLRFLERTGCARRIGTEREGRRPLRRRYAITPKGRDYFADLLRETWRRPSPVAQPVDVALAAMAELPDDEVRALLAERRDALAERLRHLDRAARSAPAREMVKRARAVTRGELEWLDALAMRRENFATRPDPDEGGRTPMARGDQPAIQLIASLVIATPGQEVLFVRYDPEEGRWWLPGADLEPYEHPDEAARRALADLRGLSVRTLQLHDVESFRGRRGWHVVFHYLVTAEGDPQAAVPAQWFARSGFPPTMHGRWERDVVQRVLGTGERAGREGPR